jgi:hypothetical protein
MFPLSSGWPQFPLFIFFALITKFNMLQIDICYLFLLAAAAITPAATLPLPAGPTDHTDPANLEYMEGFAQRNGFRFDEVDQALSFLSPTGNFHPIS